MRIISDSDGWCMIKDPSCPSLLLREEKVEELRQELNKWHFEKNEKEKAEKI